MPIDTPEASAAPTTRRGFLTRAALGGAVVTAGAVAGPFGRLVPLAGAQGGGSGGDAIDDVALLEFAGPLEKAAVLAYQAALDNGSLDEEWTELARQFQSNHRDAADALVANAGEGEEPAPSEELLTRFATPLAGADAPTTLRTLSEMEDLLATTHLGALASIPDPVSSRAVAQVLAVESQQAVLLGRAAGIGLDELTPAVAPTEGGLDPSASGSDAGSDSTTTTTTAEGGEASGGDGSSAEDAATEGAGADSGSEDADTSSAD